jgi:predicted RNA polymerase sigma factor
VDHVIDILPSDLGNIHWKLAEVLQKEQKNVKAKESYKQALKLIEGDTNKEKIEEMLKTIESQSRKPGGYRF